LLPIQVLGDLVESSVGAILLDTGFDLNHIWKIMLSFLNPISSFSNLQINPVRELKELCQSHNWDFEVPASKKGRTFSVDVTLSGKDMNISASASNSNKKEAIRMASEKIYARLKVKPVYLWIFFTCSSPCEITDSYSEIIN
jgi:endoribonuclease Dicer